MRCRSEACEGVIEPIVVHSHKGHLIVQEEECSGCGQKFALKNIEKEKFEKQVNLFDEMAGENLEVWMDKADTRRTLKIRCEETMSQAVLKKIMPGRDLIQVDIGNRDSQFDLLSKKDTHTIAIEITQAVNQNALESESYLKHHNHVFEMRRSRYRWIMGINKTMKLSNKSLLKMENFLIEIEKHHIDSSDSGKIESSVYRYSQLTAVEQLEKLGVICFSGEPAITGVGSINIQGPVDG